MNVLYFESTIMTERVTLEHLEQLLSQTPNENDETDFGTKLSSLTATVFGIAGSLGGERGESNSEPSALKKLLLSYDKDGEITKEDIESFLNELGSFPTDDEIQEKIDAVDSDDNGILDLNEFLHFLQNELQITDTEEDVVEAFKVFDKDGNGFINAAEIRRVMTNLGDKLTDDEVDQMIRMSDLDGDGMVNYEEFVRIMMERIKQYEKLSKE